jgi:hypothetical protein
MCFRCLEEVIPKRLVDFLDCSVSDQRESKIEKHLYLRKTVGMSSYNGDGILPWLRIPQWHVLLDGQLKDCLLPRLRCIGVFSNVLTRNGMFYDLEIRRHGGGTTDIVSGDLQRWNPNPRDVRGARWILESLRRKGKADFGASAWLVLQKAWQSANALSQRYDDARPIKAYRITVYSIRCI